VSAIGSLSQTDEHPKESSMKSTQQTDLELLAAWRAGDLAAGDALLVRHYDSVHRFFSNRIGRDCEDLIQATFLGCIEAIDRFRAESSFRTLLFAVAWRKLCRHLRDRGPIVQPLDPVALPLAVNAPTFGTQLDANRDAELLREAMLRLPDDTRMMLELFYWEAMPVQEIACVLERRVGTVKTRMRRGRAQLVAELAALRKAATPKLVHLM
jgi:RNA polymerase sigma-70 factor (ECF subfamily)